MKHLGILAHSVEGASLCMRTFAQAGFRELGPHQHPDFTLDCIAMGRSMQAWDEGDYVAIREILGTSVARLADAGADFFVCPDNTAHLALEARGEPFPLPGLHIADVVAERAERSGHERVGVLGTRFLMESDLYPDAFGERGIDAVIPEPDDRAVIHAAIFEELVNGVFAEATLGEFVRIIERLADEGCDAVALVCTEIPLLVKPSASPLPTLNSTGLLADAAYEVAVGHRPMPIWRGGPFASAREAARG